MPVGPGKYDDIATEVREKTNAAGVMVVILNGNRGQGFSCQFTDLKYQAFLPGMLRQLADEIEGGRQ